MAVDQDPGVVRHEAPVCALCTEQGSRARGQHHPHLREEVRVAARGHQAAEGEEWGDLVSRQDPRRVLQIRPPPEAACRAPCRCLEGLCRRGGGRHRLARQT
eukprot:12370952-Heterocapsa_arctica.AAC.1